MALCRAKAKFDYQARGANELGFSAGEEIIVMKKDDRGLWWQGSVGNRKGWFPVSYIEVVADFSAGTAKAPPPSPRNTENGTARTTSSPNMVPGTCHIIFFYLFYFTTNAYLFDFLKR